MTGGEILAAANCSNDGPPLQVGDLVVFGEGKTGNITRAYLLEDKYAVKAVAGNREIRGPNNSFVYFKKKELVRAVPLTETGEGQASEESAAKRHRGPSESVDGAEDSAPELAPGRFLGKVKWYLKEKGFGKIQPLHANSQSELPTEDVFLHRNQFQGGQEGAHANVVAEGVIVTFEVTTYYDGKPCACNVEVEAVSKSQSTNGEAIGQKSELIRRLLLTGMSSGTFQVKGVGKATMEDRFIMRPGVPVDSIGVSCRKAVCGLYGVFDGHSGASCSDFVANNLDRSLYDSLRLRKDASSDVAMRSTLLAAFRMTEHNYYQYLNKLEGGAAHAWATAGSTACSAVFYGPDEDGRLKLAVANAGDSRVVLGKRDGSAVRLSEDHTPDVPSERRRIEQEGSAVVNANGIWRIVLPSKRGLGLAGLSVSRGFGDLEYKQPAAVVSAVPDVAIRTVDLREDSFVVFASDGVWGPVSDSDAVRIVAAALREGNENPTGHAARQLVEEAHRRDGNDDKTAVVVWFGDIPAAPPVATTMPPLNSATRMQPRQVMVAAARGEGGGDDMFAIKRPLSVAQAGKSAEQSEMSDLDDLFPGYAQDTGMK